MEMHEVITKRRTIRIFRKKASEEQLKKIILAGTQAPSARNSQPWEAQFMRTRRPLLPFWRKCLLLIQNIKNKEKQEGGRLLFCSSWPYVFVKSSLSA